MSNVKVLKKGEYLFKEGDKIQTVFILQTGQINLCLQKNKKNIDIMNVGAGFVFADLLVLNTAQYIYSGMATQETKVVEIPIDSFKQQYESLHQIYKSFIKTMAEKLKWSVNEVKVSKLEKNPSPCADDAIPKVFGVIFHVLNHKGLKEGSSAKVDWITLRQYSQRIFGESIKRIEQASQVLVKLKLADYVYGKNPDDPESKDEIQGLKIQDMVALESFFEFYQYYYYKGGKAELLKFDETTYNTLRVLLMSYEGVEADRFGIVSKDFSEVVAFFKDYGINLGNGHFTSLETKGLFCKRKAISEKTFLQFEIKEFRTQIDIWKVLREIDKWNEKGIVDMADIDEGPKKKQVIEGGVECAQCHFVMIQASKFCSECGAKMSAFSAEKKAA
ncbi:MAG: cyclic nucleotide-binding domain-containing protein [Bdellovibrionaceae bacterium]|nr:cyclic nucleotide-binding domain-containing protein [Pseudobdellovibrionaceae bacterium]